MIGKVQFYLASLVVPCVFGCEQRPALMTDTDATDPPDASSASGGQNGTTGELMPQKAKAPLPAVDGEDPEARAPVQAPSAAKAPTSGSGCVPPPEKLADQCRQSGSVRLAKGQALFYRDRDGDEWGNSNCVLVGDAKRGICGYVRVDGDCDVANRRIHPGTHEVCRDGVDNNCDGLVDNGCPVDCQLTGWSDWDACDASIGGFRERSRRVVAPPSEGGARCGPLTQSRRCPVDCELGEWSDWTRCLPGSRVQSRSRYIIQEPLNGGARCGEMNQERSCSD